MKRDNDRQTAIILSIVGIVPVMWLALLIAPSISGGLPEIAANLATLFDNPFSIKLCGDSLKTVLILLLCYGMGIGIYFSTRKNYRRREEHGSAKCLLCVTTTTHFPNSCAVFFSKAMISSAVVSSRFPVGSSAKST